MPWIEDTDLEEQVKAVLEITGTNLNTAWQDLIPYALQRARGIITRALATKGYTSAQIDAWDDLTEFHRDQSVYEILVNASAEQPADQTTIDKLDRREELATVAVMIGGELAPIAGGAAISVQRLKNGCFGPHTKW